ncbi:polyketide cyclase / dehydrase and lipid transport [Mycolicibacterium fluoranthenivorans]|uniref:SRPBCC family protein n=1 Tax=Mycolicibacterium fluoranthenivorans TaxID=258505 RepID=A0A1G4WQV3_9MYCO|nr:polyketide cyclase / dehydrase and lipid transport [Mycolicibacterium fluoranthenivorans]SCX27702.1 hypothetical protein SAMN02799620_04389 [Mycolicibacterium fluoranthenivorans]
MRWTVGSTHTLSDLIPAEPAAVRAFYVDLANITLVHPLVVSVRPTRHRETPGGGQLRAYRVRDRIPLGRLVLRASYAAELYIPARGEVLTAARQFPGVRLFGRVSFDGTAEGTTLTEHLHITAPAVLAALTVRQALAAHVSMLAGIRRHFQALR